MYYQCRSVDWNFEEPYAIIDVSSYEICGYSCMTMMHLIVHDLKGVILLLSC